MRPDGTQLTRTLIVPVDLGTVHDTWSVVGMRGTGSKDFVVDDVFVPVERTFSLDDEPYDAAPLYNRRSVMVTIWTLNAANSLGMARGAINAFVELASSLGSTSASTLLRDRPAVQATLGEAEAIISGARAYLLDSVGTAWNAICDGISDPGREIAQARLAITHAIQESVRAVDLLFRAGGTNTIHHKHSIERFFETYTSPGSTALVRPQTWNLRGRCIWDSIPTFRAGLFPPRISRSNWSRSSLSNRTTYRSRPMAATLLRQHS